jgi:hypothetical protein
MNDTRIEEYRFLRQELEANRKYIFERPLLIIGGTLAATASLSDREILSIIPIPYLAILLFNLWFTSNRLRSSGRIVAYIQLVHEGKPIYKWVGWENALRDHRRWTYKNKDELKLIHRYVGTILHHHSMAYYPQIFYFHLLLGVIVAIGVITRLYAFHDLKTGADKSIDTILLSLNVICIVVFVLVSIPFQPGRIRHSIEKNRFVWEQILPFASTEINANERCDEHVPPSDV